jgi:hypothetical protein
VRILIETSGGGGIVLVVVAALLAGHGGGLDAALAAMLIALAVVIALAVGGLVALVVYRARRTLQPPVLVRQVPAAVPAVRQLDAQDRPAIEAPAVRLLPGQLAELAELIRRGERPE